MIFFLLLKITRKELTNILCVPRIDREMIMIFFYGSVEIFKEIRTFHWTE